MNRYRLVMSRCGHALFVDRYRSSWDNVTQWVEDGYMYYSVPGWSAK